MASDSTSTTFDSRDDQIAHKLVALAIPQTLTVIARREHHSEVELGNDDQELPPGAVRVIRLVSLSAGFDRDHVPGPALIHVVIILDERVAMQPRRLGGDVRVR